MILKLAAREAHYKSHTSQIIAAHCLVFVNYWCITGLGYTDLLQVGLIVREHSKLILKYAYFLKLYFFQCTAKYGKNNNQYCYVGATGIELTYLLTLRTSVLRGHT